MNDEIEKEAFCVLKTNSGDFTWCIDDIKGRSPSMRMNETLIKDEANPIVEHQRKLNPILKERVKKKLNFDFQFMGEKRLLQLNELEEIGNESYDNARYTRTK